MRTNTHVHVLSLQNTTDSKDVITLAAVVTNNTNQLPALSCSHTEVERKKPANLNKENHNETYAYTGQSYGNEIKCFPIMLKKPFDPSSAFSQKYIANHGSK